jgi:hypothetical protein
MEKQELEERVERAERKAEEFKIRSQRFDELTTVVAEGTPEVDLRNQLKAMARKMAAYEVYN